MMIFDGKNLNPEWVKGEVPGTYYGQSEKGWIDCELFKGWLSRHVFTHAVAGRPLLIPKRGTGNGSLQPKRKGWMPTNRSHSRICDGHFVFWYVDHSAPGLDKAQVGQLISLLSILCL